MEGGRFPLNLVLDTSALWDKPLADALVDAKVAGLLDDDRLRVTLPCVAYAERLRQLARDGRDTVRWREELEAMGIRLEPFGAREADRIPSFRIGDAAWKRDARDAMCAAHVSADRTAVTADGGGVWTGIDVMTPAEATEAIRALLGPFP